MYTIIDQIRNDVERLKDIHAATANDWKDNMAEKFEDISISRISILTENFCNSSSVFAQRMNQDREKLARIAYKY